MSTKRPWLLRNKMPGLLWIQQCRHAAEAFEYRRVCTTVHSQSLPEVVSRQDITYSPDVRHRRTTEVACHA